MLLEYILCFLELLILYIVLSRFVNAKYSLKIIIIVISLFALIELIISVFVQSQIANFIYPLIISIFGFICFQDNKVKILLITLTFYLFEGVLSILTINLFGIIFKEKIDVLLSLNNTRYIFGFLNKLLSATPLLFISPKIKGFEVAKIEKGFALILMLSIISIVICVFIGYDISLQDLSINVKEILIIFVVILSFTLLASLILTIIHIRTLNKLNILLLEKNNNTLMNGWYQEIESNQHEISKVKHDIKNTLQSIRTLLNNGDQNGAIGIINEITNSTEIASTISWTNNSLFDSIIFRKLIRNSDINLNIGRGLIPDYLSKIDLSLLFSNLIDNAIEETKKTNNKEIKIEFDYSELGYLIKITNSSNRLDIDFSKTLKENEGEHGWGIKIINSIVEKYHGEIVYKVVPKFVQVLVYLPIDYE